MRAAPLRSVGGSSVPGSVARTAGEYPIIASDPNNMIRIAISINRISIGISLNMINIGMSINEGKIGINKVDIDTSVNRLYISLSIRPKIEHHQQNIEDTLRLCSLCLIQFSKF